MDINTTRFGSLSVDAGDLIHFPGGLPGLEECEHWALLADAENASLGWLQSTSRADVALAVVSPRRFVSGYQLRVAGKELEPLSLKSVHQAQVLAIVGKNERSMTLNLKAPLVINPELRLGRQVIANGDVPVQYELDSQPAALRKSA